MREAIEFTSQNGKIFQIFLENNNIGIEKFFSLLPSNNTHNRLKLKDKEKFILPKNLKDILIGLLLGDIHARFRFGKTSFVFLQGIGNQEFLYHLYNLFSHYCPSEPKIKSNPTDIRTGKIYSNISFTTYTLPCFNELYHLFYLSKKK